MPAETHSAGVPTGRAEIEALVRDLLGEILAIDGVPDLGADLRTELGLDDLALHELVAAIEDDLGERTIGLGIDDDDLDELRTAADLVDSAVAALGEPAS